MRKIFYLFIMLALACPLATPAAALGEDPQASLEQARARLQAGQRSEALGLIDQAAQTIWNQMGLSVGLAVLTKEDAQGFGMFNPRDNNVFADGEPILAYVEPRGYRVTSPQPGLFAFGIKVDVALLGPQGDILWGKENLLVKNVLSRQFNREFYITLTLNFTGAPAGNYVVLLTLHDQQAPGPVQVRLPIRFN
jgi:hypothetical protein